MKVIYKMKNNIHAFRHSGYDNIGKHYIHFMATQLELKLSI